MKYKALFRILLLLVLVTLVHGAVQATAQTNEAAWPLSGAAAPDLVIPGEMVVKLKPGFEIAALAELNNLFAVAAIERLFPNASDSFAQIYRLKLDPASDVWHVALAYAEHPAVAYAEPNMRAWLTGGPNDPLVSTQWNLHNVGQTGGAPDADVDAREAGAFYLEHPPVYDPVVAILDTGVDYNHPDLAAAMLPGYDFLGDDADPMDMEGHGTGTASIVGAGINNGVGLAGLCPNCSILPVRVGAWVVHFGSIEVAEGIMYAANPAQGNADIISMSLGGTCSDLWTDAVDYAHDQDVFMVAAAGNYTLVVVYPAAYPRVMAAGATDHYDDVPWWVPILGAIEMYAPGVDVPVADLGNGYDTMTGTSSATPHLAATAGLLLGQNPNLTVPELRQIIINTGDEKGSFLNRYYRLNTFQAILQADSPPGNPYDPGHEQCQIIPLAPQRAAFEQAVADFDARLTGQPLATLLQRHRLQIAALLMANSDLFEHALSVEKDPALWKTLLSGLAQKASPVLQEELQNLIDTTL